MKLIDRKKGMLISEIAMKIYFLNQKQQIESI
jgi:hypothetical protein